jgi:hypothetical protein
VRRPTRRGRPGTRARLSDVLTPPSGRAAAGREHVRVDQGRRLLRGRDLDPVGVIRGGSGIVGHLAHKPSSVPDAAPPLSPLERVVDPHTFETLRFDSGVKGSRVKGRGVTTCKSCGHSAPRLTGGQELGDERTRTISNQNRSHPSTSPRRDADRSLRNRSQRATSTLALDGVRGSGVVVCVTERRRRPMTSSYGCPPLLYR